MILYGYTPKDNAIHVVASSQMSVLLGILCNHIGLNQEFPGKTRNSGQNLLANQEAPKIQNQEPKTKPGSLKISQEQNHNWISVSATSWFQQ